MFLNCLIPSNKVARINLGSYISVGAAHICLFDGVKCRDVCCWSHIYLFDVVFTVDYRTYAKGL